MGVMSLPQVHMYCSRGTQTLLIAENMTRNRFYKLRNHLHFVDSSVRTDKQKKEQLHLVRPILDSFQSACRLLPRTAQVSIDKQMIPFSGRCKFRQYLPSKPNPVWLKIFVHALPAEGLVLDFLIYTVKDAVADADAKRYGLGGAVVKKLMEIVTTKNSHVFTDRYLTGLKIIDLLLTEDKFITGTVNENRTGGASARLPNDESWRSNLSRA